MAIKDGLLADFDHEMGTTRKLLERLPDDKLAWKPHEKSMSLGGLATHLGNIPSWGGASSMTLLRSGGGAAAPAEKTSRAEILAAFDRGAGEDPGVDGQDRRRVRRAVDADPRRPGGFHVPRVAAFRNFVLHHIIHHRGQLSVYLRLNDVPVPAIYGPSADEG